jgi:peptide-methionine (S)-S-oxide reductase
MKHVVTVILALAASCGLAFAEESTVTTNVPALETATFGGGCFWCMEAVFEQTPGVSKVVSGYMGGRTANPTYKEVCAGDSGHVEVIQVTYDPAKVTFGKLLDVFWHSHDPTQLNRQGNDVGEQYRSVVFHHGVKQRDEAAAAKKTLAASGLYKDPIVTAIEPASPFFEAEAYHQEYYRNNRSQGYCQFVIRPKLKKLGLQE